MWPLWEQHLRNASQLLIQLLMLTTDRQINRWTMSMLKAPFPWCGGLGFEIYCWLMLVDPLWSEVIWSLFEVFQLLIFHTLVYTSCLSTLFLSGLYAVWSLLFMSDRYVAIHSWYTLVLSSWRPQHWMALQLLSVRIWQASSVRQIMDHVTQEAWCVW